MSSQPHQSSTNSSSYPQPGPASQDANWSTVTNRSSPAPHHQTSRPKSSKKGHKTKKSSHIDLLGIGSQFD
ncbi:hypothetical protein MGN70_012279, partial [Eutypa lata]